MKSDLQVHSPHDRNWEGEKLQGGSPEDEAKRALWANSFIDACITRGLSAVAITDHHDFTFVPYVQSAIEQRGLKDKLILFPGTEVTCNDSSQCLVLFDRDTDESLWDQMFGLLPRIRKPAPETQAAAQADLCGRDITELLKELDRNTVIEGKFIALPNGSGEGGHKTVLRRGYHDRFAALQSVGVYSDHALSEYKPVDLKEIRGEIKEWGYRRRGILPTGDNRSQNFEKLGKNPCWIKLGEPTTEAIRQALLADEARVRYEPPIYAAQRITGMTVSSTLTGELTLTFNEGFNALIGGRGSGKSALLEYIRFGLGRSAVDFGVDQERTRERELLESTLAGGSVSLELERNGVRERWLRKGGSSVIEVLVPDSLSESVTTDEARQRFRARCFSQKQLSTLIRTSDDVADQITGIAAAQSIDRRRDIEQEISELKRAVQNSAAKMVEFWTAEGLHDSAVKNVTDLRRRIATTKAQLEEEGLTDEQRNILERAPAYDLAEALLPEAANALTSDLEQVRRLISSIPSVDKSRREEVKEFPELNDFYARIDAAAPLITGHLRSVEAELAKLTESQVTATTQFEISSVEFRKEHLAASSGQARLANLINESNRLAKELQEAESKQRQQKALLDSLSSASGELQASRERLARAQKKLSDLLEDAANEVSAVPSGVLKASVLKESVPRDLVEIFEVLCEQCHVRDSLARCTERVTEIMAADQATIWESLAQSALQLLKMRVQGPPGPVSQVGQDVISQINSILFPLTPQQFAKVFEGVDSRKVGLLLAASPKSFIDFEYRDSKGYIPFSQASQGQQAAALLDLLLRQHAGTLIIDQPEDDLDNRVIMDVANLLHESKSGRQLIFTTHNANFVVNGDADKVIALVAGSPADVSGANAGLRVQIETDGAIETPKVRQVITDTVEGGKEAFDLRARKYKFMNS
jgi:ABC-type cobalamin/Fe3+-siderophores transport system ATPase subunit